MENAHPTSLVALDYASCTAPCSRVATASLILGIVGAAAGVIFIGVVPGVIAIIVGLVAHHRINRNMKLLSGERAANWGIGLGCLSIVIAFGTAILMPCGCGKPRELSNRSYCAATLRGIAQSMTVYAADNHDSFPILPFAPYGVANAYPSEDTTVIPPDTSDSLAASFAVKAFYGNASLLNGSPLANIWLLARMGYIAPKQLLCKSDPFEGLAPASLEKSPRVVWLNVQKPDQLSYAFAYPYAPDGKPGTWWKNTTDSSLPLAADMPSKNGTGSPAKNVAPGKLPTDPKSWNSPNHQFEGQNVAFADGHAEFVRRPDIGQGGDNIFTYTGTKAVSAFGGIQPTAAPISILTDAAPYDIVLVPARNLKRGNVE